MTAQDDSQPTRADTDADTDASPAPSEAQPFRIGRYTVLRQLGRGGMGVVYAAYDDELDRRIALKVLTSGATEGSLGKARMLREAQALARLSHPNVVQVYEVGGAADRLHLAMEFVEGRDLKGWLTAAPRTWRQILDVCVQAGHGLAAAHAAGLVHRDFKPANTIVGEDGRVRVIDFGLARADLEADPTFTLSGRPIVLSTSSLVDNLTQAGTLLGTPAYMAPEQLFRQPADARSDLYAFCVTTWEALYGARPFQALTVDELRSQVIHGPPPPPPGRRVPAAVHRALARGLAYATGERPPDMPALLAELARAADARRRRWLVLGTGATLALTLGAGYLLARAPDLDLGRCAAAGDLTGVWDEPTRDAVEAAVRATGLAYAADTWTAVAPRLDAYAADLTGRLQQACLAAPPAVDPALGERALCLGRRRQGLVALVGVLRRADAGAVAGAADAVAALEPLAACEGLPVRPREDPGAPVDPARALATAAVWQQLAEARAEMHAEHYERGLEIARAALAAAEPLGERRMIADALLRAALLEEGAGNARAARGLAHRAHVAAEAAADDALALDVTTALVRLEGAELRDLSATRAWTAVAEAKLERAAATDIQRIRLLLESGIGLVESGALPEGAPRIAEAVAAAEQVREASPRIYISALNIRASGVLKRTGDLPGALALTRRAIELAERHYGVDHPYNGMLIHNLGVMQYEARDLEAARVSFERSIRIREAAYGAHHPEVAQALNGLGAALGDLGRFDAAIPVVRRALAIEETRRGADHPELVYPLNNLASVLLQAKRPDEAEPPLRRARAIIEARELGDTALAAMVDESLANLALARGRRDEAVAMLTRAAAALAHALGPDNPGVAHLHLALAEVLLDLGQRDAAATHYKSAAPVLAAHPEYAEDGERGRKLHERLALP
ncbi:MAG: serine/threonine protein kinase [Myxococcales bacterium]|nr:serine/threonine protein kinase [Myxococcales bacterium]